MEDESLKKLSIISTCVGIFLIHLGAVQMQADLTPISRINKDFEGLKTKISGRIIDLKSHPEGHLFLKIKDESGGVIKVPIFKSLKKKLDKKIELLDNVEVEGKIKKYEGELELLPEKAESINIIHSTPIHLSKINNEEIGKIIKVKGIVENETVVSNKSRIIILRDGKEELKVFVPSNVAKSEFFPDLSIGETVKIGGLVQKYEGELEIKVEDSWNVKPVVDG